MAERGTWVMRDGKLIPKHEAPPLNPVHGRGPMIISGTIDHVLNMADGKRYTCKRSYEKAVRAAGCEIIGNEPVEKRANVYVPDRKEIRKDVVEAIQKVEQGYKPQVAKAD